MMVSDMKYHYDYAMLELDVNAIYHKVLRDEFEPDYIIGLARGGLVPAVWLSHKLKTPMLTLNWGRDITSPNKYIDSLVADNSKMLIVDDICDTGATVESIFSHWGETVDVNNFRIASLVNYCSDNDLYTNQTGSIICNYQGRTMSDQPWVDFFWEE